jgi:hypothetical protein
MSIRPFSHALLALAFSAGLAGCAPSENLPTSLFWDVPPPSASTNAVLVDSAVYIGERVAEVAQRWRCTVEHPAPTANL